MTIHQYFNEHFLTFVKRLVVSCTVRFCCFSAELYKLGAKLQTINQTTKYFEEKVLLKITKRIIVYVC